MWCNVIVLCSIFLMDDFEASMSYSNQPKSLLDLSLLANNIISCACSYSKNTYLSLNHSQISVHTNSSSPKTDYWYAAICSEQLKVVTTNGIAFRTTVNSVISNHNHNHNSDLHHSFYITVTHPLLLSVECVSCCCLYDCWYSVKIQSARLPMYKV